MLYRAGVGFPYGKVKHGLWLSSANGGLLVTNDHGFTTGDVVAVESEEPAMAEKSVEVSLRGPIAGRFGPLLIFRRDIKWVVSHEMGKLLRAMTAGWVALRSRPGGGESIGFYLVLGFLILLPQALSSPWVPKRWGLPLLFSGDEPHYMVQIKSLVKDGDLDVLNNYRSALAGRDDAGKVFRGHRIDRHMSAAVDGRAVLWSDVYQTDNWKARPDGTWPSAPRRYPTSGTPPKFQYSWHPDGLAVLFAPLWLLIGNSSLLEPFVLFCSGLVTLAGVAFFRHIVGSFTSDTTARRLAILAAFLGTPIWHYSRGLYTEPYLACFGLAAYSLALRPRAKWLAGIPAGAALLFKPVFVLIVAPLFLLFLIRRRFGDLLLSAVPIVMAVSYILWCNTVRFGGPFTFSHPPLFEWDFAHALEFITDTKKGLVAFAPVVLIAFAGWHPLFRTGGGEARAMALGSLLYFLLMSCWVMWHGGYCYGPRLLLPIIPLIMIGMAKSRETFLFRGSWMSAISAAIIVISIQINALGALPYWRFWGVHPFASVF